MISELRAERQYDSSLLVVNITNGVKGHGDANRYSWQKDEWTKTRHK